MGKQRHNKPNLATWYAAERTYLLFYAVLLLVQNIQCFPEFVFGDLMKLLSDRQTETFLQKSKQIYEEKREKEEEQNEGERVRRERKLNENKILKRTGADKNGNKSHETWLV